MSRRYSRRNVLRLGAGLAGAALLGACGEEAPPSATPTTEPTRRVRLRSRPLSPSPPPSEGRVQLGSIRGAGWMSSLDRLETLLVYSRLVSVDPRTSTVFADLANAIEVPEPLTIRVEMQRGLRFHPGPDEKSDPLDAEAVVRDFERRRAESAFLMTDVVDTLEARSNHVVMHLRAPFSLLFELLGRAEYSIRGDQRYPRIGAPVGSGAFVPVETTGLDRVFVANPRLTGSARPRLAEVVTRGAESERDLDRRFARGDLDVRPHPDAVSRQAAAERPDRVEVTRPSQGMRALALSLMPSASSSPDRAQQFRDARVRRALSLALDRAAICRADGSLQTGPVGPAHAGDALPLAELKGHALLQHDPTEARSLLAAAGAPDLSFRLMLASTSSMLTLAQNIAGQLRRAGISVRLQALPAEEFEPAFLRGAFEAALFELRGLDTPDIGLRLHTSGGLDGRASPWGYSNPPYDAAVREALSQLDPEIRARRSRDAQRRLLQDVPAMFPLNTPSESASLSARLTGYEFDAYDHNLGHLAGGWSVSAPAL